MENIKILSETYDIGVKEMKYTKGVEHRSKAINGQAVSALLVGSPGHILYDETTRKKFNIAFMSKLARRSWFCYVPAALPAPELHTTDQIFEHAQKLNTQTLNAVANMSEYTRSVAEWGIASAGKDIGVTEEVFRLFEIYKRYNSEIAETVLNPDSTTALIRRHLQWKALKFAGALAIFDKSDTVQKHHYIDAIRFCELLDKDMAIFERDLNKSPHERFSDYIRTLVQTNNKAIINVHDLKKANFITTVSTTKLQELVHLAAGYDTSGVYSIINDGGAIQYEPIIKTEVVGISYKPIDISELNTAVQSKDKDKIREAKHAISVTTAYGYEVSDTTFADIGNLLEGNYAYSPFKFKNGVRSKDNIIGGTKWVVLDVDASPITASEAHFMLSDINHHIALSSDPDNEYKFRVVIELDSSVDLSAIAWKHFYQAIADDLALKVDPLPQSQIFFSYANRPVLSNLDAEPLEARPYLLVAKEREAVKEHKEHSITTSQKQAYLKDSETTFAFAFNARPGEGSRSLIRAAYYARDLGADATYVHSLIDEVNDYWSLDYGSMDERRIQLLHEQISRMFRS